MSPFRRRRFLQAVAGASVAISTGARGTLSGQQQSPAPLDITQFEPRSMLNVKETAVPKARFPVIDIHTHLSWAAKSSKGVSLTGDRKFIATPADLLPVMDAKNLKTMVNLTGGYGDGLREGLKRFDRAHPGRFLTFTEPMWARINEPNYPKIQADELRIAKGNGARGIKILKTLGLYLRENITSGKLVAIDDKRFDPMWEEAGALKLPICIHVSDPAAFFLPTDRYNERFEELNNHPDWSFHGRDFPSNAELLAARDRVYARHPKTQFIGLHVGHFAENLAHVGQTLDKFPNVSVEIGARIGELGRQPRTARRFFDRYQDRILFGTDAVPGGIETPQQIFNEKLYEIYFRFLETEDEYFDYAPAKVPPQGRWRIYGIGLPEKILRKVYHQNAENILNG